MRDDGGTGTVSEALGHVAVAVWTGGGERSTAGARPAARTHRGTSPDRADRGGTGGRRCAQSGLLAAIRERIGPCELLASRLSSWSSITFDGARHRLELSQARDGAGTFDAPDRVDGHAVIDFTTSWSGGVLTIEATTVAEA